MIGRANLLVTALLVAGCCQSIAARRWVKRDSDQTPSQDRFNFFDLELLQRVAQAQSGNVLISPVSIKATLAMILEGAGGKSAEEIHNALRLPDNPSAIQKVFKAYLSSLMKQHSGQKLSLSNRVFISKKLAINQNYERSLMRNYFASIVGVDFSRPQKTAAVINNWIQNVTNNLVPSLVDAGSIQPDAQILLANAIYFKGKWLTPFDNDGTVTRCFYTALGVCRNASMMETLGYHGYAYVQGLDAYALELPYEGDQFSMVIVMPKEVEGITQLVRDILHVPLHTIINSLQETEVLLSIPRFDIEYSTDLIHTLHELGMREIFSPLANLSGLFSGNDRTAQISNVFHKAKIIVNEEGSEAGAGTGALVIPLMGSTIPKFRADRPFLFFLRDKTTGVVLFAGRVSEPEPVKPPQTEEELLSSVFSPERPVKRPERPTTSRPKGPYPKPSTPATERKPTTTTEGTEIVDTYISNSNSNLQIHANVNNNQGQTTSGKSTDIDFNPPNDKPTYAKVASKYNQNQNTQSEMDMQNNQNVQQVHQPRIPVVAQPTPDVYRARQPQSQPQFQPAFQQPYQQPYQPQVDRPVITVDPLPLSVPQAPYQPQGNTYSSYQPSNNLGDYPRRMEPVYVRPSAPSYSPPQFEAPQQQYNTHTNNQNGYNSRTSHQYPPQNNDYDSSKQVVRTLERQNSNGHNPVDNQQYLTSQRHFQGNAQAAPRYEQPYDAQTRSTGGQRNNFVQPQGGNQQGIVFRSE